MDDILRLFGVFTAMGMAGAGVYAVIAVVNALTRRLERRPIEAEESLRAELEDLRARVQESDQLGARVADLEERLDFAERLLARQKDATALPGGRNA